MQLYIVTTQTFEPFSVYYLNGYNQSTCGCRRLRPERKKQGPILCWCLKAGCSAVLVPRQRGVGTPLFQMSAASVVFLFCCHDKNTLGYLTYNSRSQFIILEKIRQELKTLVRSHPHSKANGKINVSLLTAHTLPESRVPAQCLCTMGWVFISRSITNQDNPHRNGHRQT